MTETVVKKAVPDDADTILELQKLSFLSEADIYGDYEIAPLKETREEILADMERQVILKAETGGRIIGSVRGTEPDKGRCYIGRLSVHPDYQNRGIGTLLMTEIERLFRNCSLFELFTGEKSEKNIYLYRKLGYQITGEKRFSDKVNAVRMTKTNREWKENN